MLSQEEKLRILKAIEDDAQFRYALMGLLGYRELLDRFSRLEERQQRLEELIAEIRQRQQILEERQQALEERFAELEERFAKLEERVIHLEERFAKLEERFLKLEERQQRLEERQQALEEAIKQLQTTLITFGNRFGVLSETAFRNAIQGIVEDMFGASAYRWTTFDSEGIVYGKPAEVEVDVVVRDGKHLLVEVKSRADTSDLLELVRIATLYERKEGVKPELAVVAGFIHPRARRLAEKLGIRIYSYLEEAPSY